MRITSLLPLALLVACDSGPSKQESVQIFASASSALNAGQSQAVAQAGGGGSGSELALDYSGPCSLGGSIKLTGSYLAGDANASDTAAFDLSAAFDGCKEPTGSLDGDLHWAATASPSLWEMSMNGDLDWTGNNASGSCELSLTMSVSDTAASYKGSLCGYDLTSDLALGGQ